MQRTVHTGVIWHDFWIGFFAVVIAIGFFMGQGVVIAFGAMGVVSGAVSLAWNRLSLDDVKYERHLPHQRAFLGEEIDVTVSLMNRKPLPLPWIRVTDELPDELRVVSGDVAANVRPKVPRSGTRPLWRGTSGFAGDTASGARNGVCSPSVRRAFRAATRSASCEVV